jgi:hypothetical protein
MRRARLNLAHQKGDPKMKISIFALVLSLIAPLATSADQANICPEKSWIVEINPTAISKDDLVNVLVSMAQADDTQVVFRGLSYTLTDLSKETGPTKGFTLSSVLATIAPLNGVSVYCNKTIGF